MWEQFFVHPRQAFDSGTLVFANVGSPSLWLAAAALISVALIGSVLWGRLTRDWRWWQKAAVSTLQVAMLLGVLGLLAGPGLQTTTLQPGANTVAVLIDTSGSMGFPNSDAEQGPSRLEAAGALAAGALADVLEPLADVALFGFDTSAARLPDLQDLGGLAARKRNTHLTDAADTVLSSFSGMPLAGLIVLSDGADNGQPGGGPPDLTRLAHHGVPVHTIGFGPLELPGEAQLLDVQLAADAPPESRVNARVVLAHSRPGTATLKVRDAGNLIAARTVDLPAGSASVRTDISFDSGESGIRELTFELEPPAGDRLAENNQMQRLLTVSERRRRILYLEGEPRWEFKFLRRAVAGDDVLDLTSWLRTTDRKTYRQGVAGEAQLADGFPADRKALYRYDLVILGSLAASALDSIQHAWLESFVAERGGSVLVLAGREALDDGRWDVQPLANALPVKLARRDSPSYISINGQTRTTRLGETSPLTQLVDAEGGDGWASLPQLGDLQLLGELKPAASVLLELATTDGAYPLLVTQPYGLGNTAVLATASTWRWQMRTPPEDPRHALFWRQLLRQLAVSAQQQRSVNLMLDDEGIAIRAWLRDEEYGAAVGGVATATITHPDRTAGTVRLGSGAVPGLLTGHYAPDEAGIYRVDVALNDASGNEASVTRFIRAGAEQREYFHPTRNEPLLRRMAEVTGGRFLEEDDVSDLTALLSFSDAGIRTVQVLPLWNLPLIFLLLVLLKLSEWLLRRRWGRI